MAARHARPHRSIDRWPDPDRRLWEAAQVSPVVIGMHPTKVRRIAGGYGLWLSALVAHGGLEPVDRPAERASPERVQAYIDGLRQRGYADITIFVRLWHLKAALRIMEPTLDPCWIVLPRRKRRQPVRITKDPLEAWPDIDRRLWRSGLQPGDFFEGPAPSRPLRPATLAGWVLTYGRWLAFLRTRGPLDASALPAERVTRANVQAYFEAHRAAGHANSSIIATLSQLRGALRIMQPEVDFGWLTAPNGRPLRSLLPVRRRPIQIIDSDVLYRWGHTLMQEALNDPIPERRQLGFRDGLMIAILAARGPRRRSLISLQIGKTMIRTGDAYRLVFAEEDIKTGRSLEYDAPAGLNTAITRYLSVERRELLAGQDHDWLWVSMYGGKLTVQGVTTIVWRRSKRRFGRPFGPHRFRHAIGTCGPLRDPEYPGVAAAILGIAGATVEVYYNRADRATAARRFLASLQEDRKRTRSLARRAFSKQAGRKGPEG
ncbi:MAG TPA: tyrosine-type recombinase/integrase [Rhodopila sp.]